jgi:hypothetical protein
VPPAADEVDAVAGVPDALDAPPTTDFRLDDAVIRITSLPTMHRSHGFAGIALDRSAQRDLKEDLIRRFLA